MIQLNITADEKNVLIGTLEDCISDLRMEIADTDRMDYRDEIKVRKELLIKVVEDLKK